MGLNIVVQMDEMVANLPEQLERGQQRGLDDIARRTQEVFGMTTATWSHRPTFQSVSVGMDERLVYTVDQQYAWVNDGVKKHTIVAQSARALAFQVHFVPKTTPGIVGSGGGSRSGPVIFRKRARMSIKARHFDTAVARQVTEQDAEPLMAGAIVEALT